MSSVGMTAAAERPVPLRRAAHPSSSAGERERRCLHTANLEGVKATRKRPDGAVPFRLAGQQHVTGLLDGVRARPLDEDDPVRHIYRLVPAFGRIDVACRLVGDTKMDAAHALDLSKWRQGGCDEMALERAGPFRQRIKAQRQHEAAIAASIREDDAADPAQRIAKRRGRLTRPWRWAVQTFEVLRA